MPTEQAYIQQLLHRYISGAITAPEEMELERLALTDEGLRQAMEGLYRAPETDHEAHIESMVSRVKPTAVRRSLFTRYAAAATLLLLLGVSALLVPRYFGDRQDAIAMEAPAMEQAPVEIPAATAPLPDSFAPAPRRPEMPSSATTDVAPPPVYVTPEAEEAEADFEVAVAEAEPAPTIVVEPAPAVPQLKRPEPQITDAASNNSTTRARTLRAVPPPVRGFVGTEDGDPIIGASITRPGLPTEVKTDSAGNFTIAYDATLTEIRVNHPGFEEEELALVDPGEPVQISLSETVSAEPMDRFLEAAARQEINFEPALKQPGEARPEGGLRALRSRIEANRPADVPAGKVRLSFLVAPDGSLSDFQFRGQPDPATMDYVGGALVESSAWNVVSGDGPVRVYLKLRFE